MTEVMFMKVINTDASLKEKYNTGMDKLISPLLYVIFSLARKSEIAFYGFFHNSTIANQRLDMMASMEFDMTMKNLNQGFKDTL